MKEYIKSPINYTGSKYRLIRKGLLDYFPKEINTFIDLFGGAGNVSINVNANKIYYNEYIPYLPKLFNTWKNQTLEETNNYIDKRIKEFNLNNTNLDGFLEFRKFYNENKNVEDLFILICFSFNYQMRFNNKQEYNSSFGKNSSCMNDNIRKNLNTFVNVIKEKDIIFLNNDFRKLKINKLNNSDFVYLDPPYSLSCGVYQDGKRGFKGWCKNDDIDLFNLLKELNERNIKFALSNLIESKGIKNELLINESKNENYNIIDLNMNYNGANYHRKTKNKNKDIEVLVTNY